MLPFGYFPCTQDVSTEPNIARLIDEIIEQSVLCEEVGFDGFFFTEHHQQEDSYLPSPILLASMVGAHTTRINVGTSVLLAPLYHPIRLAEEIAVIDQATKGRMIAALGIGYLPEESYLYRYLNSKETLDFFGGLFALDPKEKAKREEQLLEMVGLTANQFRAVGEFSKGMQRRIGLAQALINDPDLVILDEPTSGLDPVGCREIKDLILNLKARGKTIILSSHLLADVEDVCDRAVIYYGGKIQQYGTLDELLTERDSMRVTFPSLTGSAKEEVMDVLKKHVKEEDLRVDNPTQNLESFFLKVVENAVSKDATTSGATSGHEVAEFLRSEGPIQSQADRMLDRLASTEKEDATDSSGEESETPAVEEDLVTEKTEAQLDRLTTAEQNAQSEPKAEPSEKESQKADLDKADKKLDDLLGGG